MCLKCMKYSELLKGENCGGLFIIIANSDIMMEVLGKSTLFS